jgi:transposase
MAGKRKALTLEDRISVLKKLDNGMSVRDVAKAYDCGRTQIQGIKNSRESLLKQWEEGGRADQKRMKIRKTTYEAVNVAVWDWFCKARSQNLPVSGKLIQVSCCFVFALFQ